MNWQRSRDFLGDTSGTVFVTVALMSFALFGMAGLGVDVGLWYSTSRTVQSAADAAAIGGAYEALEGGDATAVENAAKDMAERNGIDPAFVTVNYPPLSGGQTGNAQAVEVIIQRPTPAFFSSVLGTDTVNITARSVAGTVAGKPICMAALDNSDSHSLRVKGGSTLTADGCAIYVNSDDDDALRVDGDGSTIDADGVYVVGGVRIDGTISPDPVTGVPPSADPLAYLTPPPYAGCDYTDMELEGGTHTLSPGVYCDGLEIEGGAVVTFEPGVYVIKDGRFKSSGGSSIQGDGVGFFLTGHDVHVEFTGSGTIDFSAPTEGPMAGLIFYQGPDADAGKENKLTGNSNAIYEGTLYFPDQDIKISGGSTQTQWAPFTAMIAQNIEIAGDSVYNIGSDYGASDVPVFQSLGVFKVALFE